ncbi:MAG: cytochrome c3 family protein, partial [Desulfosarcina sp.]|nr:cytochrome c3 family protein [Desulfobacterales bacterium]
MKYTKFIMLSPIMLMFAMSAQAVTSKCEECHTKLTPGIVKDFNRGVMSEELTCTACHGKGHMGKDDVAKAKLPTISTCQECHDDQASQYLGGKHAKGLLPITAFPGFAHKQPTAFIAGQKGCNGCHN